MLKVLHQLYKLLSPSERRRLRSIMPLMIFVGMMEVVGMSFILPFVALVADQNALQQHKIAFLVYNYLGFSDSHYFLLCLGFIILGVLIIANICSALTVWLVLHFVHQINSSLSSKLFAKYLRQPYPFFLGKNAATLSKNILDEVAIVTSSVLIFAIQMFAKIVVIVFIVSFIVLVNPMIALSISLVIGGFYSSIYLLARHLLKKLGQNRSKSQEQRYRSVHECFGGIKDIKLLRNEAFFIESFNKNSQGMARYLATCDSIAQLPRYGLEIVAFGGILSFILYMLASSAESSTIIPMIGLFAFAGYRLLPALQYVFAAISSIRTYSGVVEDLARDFNRSELPTLNIAFQKSVDFTSSIELRNIQFTYPHKKIPVLNDFNLTIKANTTVGFFGTTGSGKTTLIDIILGLLTPEKGLMKIDDVEMSSEYTIAWQQKLGYVAQHIYLTDDTITRNIAFGLEDNQIDFERVKWAAQIAQLGNFIQQELELGYETMVGDCGVRLSGGQRQRIGIARALYRDPEVLILDEATSALDGGTEKALLNGIKQLTHKKTIIMIAHRLTTLRDCDMIYQLEEGKIVSQGQYRQLLLNNEKFRELTAEERV